MNRLRNIKKKLYPNNLINRWLLNFNGSKGCLGRDNQDSEVQSFMSDMNNRGCDISAVYRVKNGEESIEMSILSIAPLVREIIFVDNGSTDNTIDIVQRLKFQLKDKVDIRIFRYEIETALAGKGYLQRVMDNPVSSLSRFYSYCFSQATSNYLMKCDAHYVFIPKGLTKIAKAIEGNSCDIIYYSGLEMHGKEMGLEPFIFNQSSGYVFEDTELYEKIKFKSNKRRVIRTPLFFHVKRLSYIKYSLKGDALKEKYGK
ncbi:Glyco_trans_2-like domain-containing protein [Vibrio chagasii]|nr:Glyco_trans_2-like domain-containing protein [Vibrio chagasii]CAH7325452.1 Glyco_trans_2-like domain-containing protein [Vibrio chagasii]CAH7363551.1 Glyco_trans_2-like domain-containing protein [Vibrio chagasii]CAH7411864.1 Glyco_trans_2-like domain-containing protein [Vibrio chagasii]CAH7476102.1 Glyco_trans_2-like domain-containing protein [Vibrio chagasii]